MTLTLKKSWSFVMSLLMAMSLCAFTTLEIGCGAMTFSQVVTSIETQLPTAVNIAGDIATLTGDPLVGTIASTASAALSADIPALQNAVAAYKANQSSGNKTALFAAVNALFASVSPQLLAANKITSSAAQQQAAKWLASIAALVSGFQLLLAPFFNATAQARQNLQQVLPFIPRDVQVQTAERFGFTLAQAGL